jgi:hypothetical protein
VLKRFGGSHIEHVIRWFNQIVAPYRPRAIVFYAGGNDIDAGKSVEGVVADFSISFHSSLRSRGLRDFLFKPRSTMRFVPAPPNAPTCITST